MNLKRYSLFLLDKEADRQDSKLRFRVKWTGGIVAFSLGYRVDPLKWSQSTQRCKQSTTHGVKKIQASVINREIQRFASALDLVFDSFEKVEKNPTVPEFRDAFNLAIGKASRVSAVAPGESFFSLFDRFVGEMGAQNTWSEATYKKFTNIRMHLMVFNSSLALASVNDETLGAFVAYQHRLELRNTTISKNVAFVRWFLRWAFNKNFYSGKSHETFRPKLKGIDYQSRDVTHLSWAELLGLLSFEVPESKAYLARVRDVFCFCCFTGLRYSDVQKLCRSDVRSTSILVVTQKTADALVIDLNKYSKALLDKYSGLPFRDDRAFPVISNVRMNIYLKELGLLAGLVEMQRVVYFNGNVRHEDVLPKYSLLTTHCGRRTFIVNALFLGIPAEVVMKWTSHSDFAAMRPYIKIVDDLKAQEMAKFDRGLFSPSLVPVLEKGD